jgi:hypothetical protein
MAQTPAQPGHDSLDARRAVFRAVADRESSDRSAAALAFPGDPWSADDDFHSNEWRTAVRTASQLGLTTSDALGAIDEGLRARWEHRNPSPLEVGVPPCHPRPIY